MVDFIKIASETSLYNFHSHTQFCDGRASMEEMTHAAIDCGMSHYGFTPHAPIACPSPCNMSREAVKPYLDEFHRLKDTHSQDIDLYVGMEIDFLSRDFGPHIDYFQRLDLDYRLASVHFVPTQDGVPVDCDGSFERFKCRLHDAFHDDLRYVVEKFYEQELTMIELGGFDVLGHFDKIGHNASLARQDIEEQHWYQALIDDVISLAHDRRLIVEVNTKAFDQHNRLFPNARFIEKVINANIPIIVNSDAHYPDKINAGRKQALELIEKITKKQITTVFS